MFIRIINSFHVSDAYGSITSFHKVLASSGYTKFAGDRMINAIAAMDTRDMR